MKTSESIREMILDEVKKIRPAEVPLIEENIRHGISHDVYKIAFPDSRYVVRVNNDAESETLERHAIQASQHVKTLRPDSRIPRTLSHNLDDNRQPGCPLLVVQELAVGEPLAVWNSGIAIASRHRFLDDLAAFLFDLWSAGIPQAMSKPMLPYTAWLENEVDRGLRRCLGGTARWGDALDYLAMRSMIPHIAAGVEGGIFTRDGLAHGDMNANNFMVDGEMHLQGVIDWDWAFTGPLPAVVQFPWFIADVPGWHNDGVESGETFEDDRAYLVSALRKKELAEGREHTLSDLLGGARKRQIFQSSIHFRDIHAEFTRSQIPTSRENIRVAKDELERFLEKHVDMTDAAGVERVRMMQ